MAKENQNVSNLTVEILKEIRTELRGLRSDFKEELNAVRTEVHDLAEYTHAGFTAVLAQGDRRFLDHEGRLRRLEAYAGFETGR